MSMHKIPVTDIERKGLEAHGLARRIGKPDISIDIFRQGVAWGLNNSNQQLFVEVYKMEESNGKKWWTVYLMKDKNAKPWEGHQVYSDAIEGRAMYEADCLKHFLGLGPEPFILDYEV